MLRYTLGPNFGVQLTAPNPNPSKADVAVTVGGVDETAWNATIAVPPYDLAVNNKLAEIRLYLVPQADGVTPPADGPSYVASELAFSPADVTSLDVKSGGNVTIPLPSVPPGNYFGQVVLGFDDAVTA